LNNTVLKFISDFEYILVD